MEKLLANWNIDFVKDLCINAQLVHFYVAVSGRKDACKIWMAYSSMRNGIVYVHNLTRTLIVFVWACCTGIMYTTAYGSNQFSHNTGATGNKVDYSTWCMFSYHIYKS